MKLTISLHFDTNRPLPQCLPREAIVYSKGSLRYLGIPDLQMRSVAVFKDSVRPISKLSAINLL